MMKKKILIKSVIYGAIISILIVGLLVSTNIQDKITRSLKPNFQKAILATIQVGVGKRGGAGIVIEQDEEYLYVLTVKHVTKLRGKLKVAVRRIDGILEIIKNIPRKNIFVDDVFDIALIKVPKPEGEFEALKLAISSPAIGDTIYTIGHPLSFHNTVNTGIVSNYLTNPLPKRKGIHMLISAPSFTGNSGGVVINNNTQVVGIVVGIMYLGKDFSDYKNTVYLTHMTFAVRLEDIKNLLFEAGVLQKKLPEVFGRYKILR